MTKDLKGSKDTERIKELRILLGLTQQQMSEFFMIKKRTIENWDGGKSEPIPWAAALLIEKMEGMLDDK